MEYEKIKKLMDDMGNSNLTSVDIDFPDGTKIKMRKESSENVIKNVISNNEKHDNKEFFLEEKDNVKVIKSPMVGTFYLKPSPTSDAFVKVGDSVSKGQTVCIIEAMKLMNEIESEFDGKIKNVLLKDGDAVEYGTELFEIE